MRRTTAAILLILLAFLQGLAGWDQFELHDVCEHGELVHASESAPSHDHAGAAATVEASSAEEAHHHCDVLCSFRHAFAMASQANVSTPVVFSQTNGIAAFAIFLPTITLASAPKTSPPVA